MLSFTATSLRLKTQLLKEVDRALIEALLARIEALVQENILDMNLLDLVQFTHQLHLNVYEIEKFELRYGLQFVSNQVMTSILDRFSECLAKGDLQKNKGHTLTLMLHSYLKTLNVISHRSNLGFVHK